MLRRNSPSKLLPHIHHPFFTPLSHSYPASHFSSFSSSLDSPLSPGDNQHATLEPRPSFLHNTARKVPISPARHTPHFSYANTPTSPNLTTPLKQPPLPSPTTSMSTKPFGQSSTPSTNPTRHAAIYSSSHSMSFHEPRSISHSHLTSCTHSSSYHCWHTRGYSSPTPSTSAATHGAPRHVYFTGSEVVLHHSAADASHKTSSKIPSAADSPQPTTLTLMAMLCRLLLHPHAKYFRSPSSMHHSLSIKTSTLHSFTTKHLESAYTSPTSPGNYSTP